MLDTAGGNPLALLEIPALLSRDELEGRAPVEGPLPPGSTLERVLARRLDGLAADTRRALLIAAAAEARRGDVVLGALRAAGLDASALEDAEGAGIVTLAPGEVTFRHPLLRAAVYHGAGVVARRAAHRAVAAACRRTTRSAPGSSPPARRGPTSSSRPRSRPPPGRHGRAPASGPPPTLTCARPSSPPRRSSEPAGWSRPRATCSPPGTRTSASHGSNRRSACSPSPRART